jgi:uncharacterized protein DUF1344
MDFSGQPGIDRSRDAAHCIARSQNSGAQTIPFQHERHWSKEGSRGRVLFILAQGEAVSLTKQLFAAHMPPSILPHFAPSTGQLKTLTKDHPMRIAISALLAISAMLAPFTAWAQSADATGKIAEVSTAEQTIKLDDGKTYQAPAEFNFEGLNQDVEVVIFYTVIDGKRMINDLELIQ